MSDEELIKGLRDQALHEREFEEDALAALLENSADAIARLTLENEKLMSCIADVQAQMRRHHARAETVERERDEARAALRGLLDLCMSVPPGGFANGITDATGTIDEGEHRASVYMDRARAAAKGGGE